MADMLVLDASAARRVGSSPTPATKYVSEPYLASEDVQKLLETYMWYANATHQDLIEWRSKLNE